MATAIAGMWPTAAEETTELSAKEHLIEIDAMNEIMLKLAKILDKTFIIEEDGTPIIKEGSTFLEVKAVIQECRDAIIGWRYYHFFAGELQSTLEWVFEFEKTIAAEERRILNEG